MADLLPVIKQRFCDANNNPLVGGKLFSYIAGTSTPKVTYRDYEGTPNTNPIILDANGECDLRIATGMYKFILKNSSDVTIWSVDKVSLPNLGGNGVPGGGLAGQVLKKVSNDDFELEWGDLDKDDVGLDQVDNTSDATKNSATATLTNKKFGDAATFTQIATPANPASGEHKIYPKSDGQFYNLNSAGVETPLGSGSGGGSKNYLGTVNLVNGNGNFELGSTAKWSLFNTTLTNKIPTGAINTGATSITTFAASFTNRLAGSFSLWVKSTGALAAGDGFITDAFTLDAEDLGKVLTPSFYYRLTGSGLVGAGTSANTFAYYLYDVANSVWVQPSNVYGMSSLNTIGYVRGEFQTATTATQYRLAVICITASSGAVDCHFDDFAVSPNQYVYGSPVIDLQDRGAISIGATTTAPAKGTTAVDILRVGRIGDQARIVGSYRQTGAGSAGSGDYLISLPSGMSFDSNKVTFFTTVLGSTAGSIPNILGSAMLFNGSSNELVGGVVPYDATRFRIMLLSDASSRGMFSPSIVSFANASMSVAFDFMAPILGWSSSVQMSDSADTRVVSFVGNTVTTQAVTANVTNVNLNTVKDSHGAWAGAVYNVPIPGDYNFDIWMGITSAALLDMNVYVDGVLTLKGATSFVSSSANLVGSGVIPNLRAGQQISFRLDVGNTIASSLTRTIAISKISGPSAIAATETIAASYYCSANFSATTSAPINFDTRELDTHGAVTVGVGWRFTAPAPGIYQVSGFQNLVTSQAIMNLYKNGSLYKSTAYASGTAVASPNTMLRLNAGEYIELRPSSSVTLTGGTPLNTQNISHIGILRVGI